MELITKAPKGTVDLVPEKAAKWQAVEEVFRSEAELNGFGEIRTPVFEHTELFLRGVGDTTDVVEKQMYTFEDKGGGPSPCGPRAPRARCGPCWRPACTTPATR